jgi:hypothetical protein
MQAEKPLPNARVERRVLLEPSVRRSLLEPKLQDILNPPIFGIIGDCGALPDLRHPENLFSRIIGETCQEASASGASTHSEF